MAIHKAWLLRCGTCDVAATFFSSDYPMEKREALKHAHEQGWRDLYGDWRCPACVPIEKKEHRARMKALTTLAGIIAEAQEVDA